MKVLMTIMMTMLMSSAYADCKLNEACATEKGCLDNNLAFIGGKCIDQSATTAKTNCEAIVDGNAKEALTGSGAAPATEVKTK